MSKINWTLRLHLACLQFRKISGANAIPTYLIGKTWHIPADAKKPLSESFIKELHRLLKTSTSHSSLVWFAVGDYKKLPNEVGGKATTNPENVAVAMAVLLTGYKPRETHTLEEIIDFHVRLERIHPFQDGNGRVGRLIMLKECLANNIVPFIISDNMKGFYYRGLAQWSTEKGYLTDTCLAAQDQFKAWLDYYRIDA